MKANDLVKQLKILGDSISVKTFSFLPIAEMLGIEGGEGRVKFSVTNQEVTSIFLADIPFEGEASVSINFKDFTALLRKLKSKEITLSYKTGFITLKTGSSSHEFPAYVDTGNEFVPATPIPKEGEIKEIADLSLESGRNQKLLPKLLQLSDSPIPRLNNLFVSNEGVYATNNYIIAKVMLDNPISKSFLIPHQIGKSFLGDEKILQYAESILSINHEDTSIYCGNYPTKDYPYQDIENVFLSKEGFWEVSSTELRDAISEMTYNAPEVLSFNRTPYRLELLAQNGCREIDIRGEGGEVQATFATEHLKTFISFLDELEEEIYILVHQDMLFAYNKDETVKIVVMGVREK